MIEWTVADSDAFKRFGYDESNRSLHVEFKSGSVYIYSDVPRETYDGLVAAQSEGNYFRQHIKDKFSFTRAS